MFDASVFFGTGGNSLTDNDELNTGISGVDSVVVVLSIFSDSDSYLSPLVPLPILLRERSLKNMSIFGILCIYSLAAAFFLLLQTPLVVLFVLLLNNLLTFHYKSSSQNRIVKFQYIR